MKSYLNILTSVLYVVAGIVLAVHGYEHTANEGLYFIAAALCFTASCYWSEKT